MQIKSSKILVFSFSVVYFIYSTTTLNFAISIVCILSFLILFQLYSNVRPFFLYAGLLMQWVSISIDLLYSNAVGISLGEKIRLARSGAGVPELMDQTLTLSHYGLICYALGLWLSIRKTNQHIDELLHIRYNASKVMLFYFSIIIFSLFFYGFLFSIPGLSQLMNFIVTIKWGVFFIMIYIALKQKKNLLLMVSLIIIDLLLGFVSFFSSSFVNVFIFLGLAFFATEVKLKIKTLIPLALVLVFALYTLLVWTAIKGEYRSFLNQGTGNQIVNVNRQEALNKFYQLSLNVDNSSIGKSTTQIIDRLGYISYFSNTIQYIPAIKPYQNGKIYLDAFSFYFKPRIFFPDKRSIDDSKHTQEYTGLAISGAGTSISLGYIADAYADFGPLFMAIPLLFLGIVTGLLYRYFQLLNVSTFWSWTMLAPFFFLTNINGVNADKAIGPILIYAVLGSISVRLLVKNLDPLLRQKNVPNSSNPIL